MIHILTSPNTIMYLFIYSSVKFDMHFDIVKSDNKLHAILDVPFF